MKTAPIVATDAVYAAKFSFNWLSAGGTAILFAGLLSVPVMPKYGYGKAIACFARTLKQLIYPILTIAMILGLAFLMNYAGMSSTLGLAFTYTGSFFPFFSPLLGWLGVFLTGSDTSSCALFGGMQKDTAITVGMSPELAVASNASGGVTAKMISPQSLSVATAATNMVGQEGNLFRFTIFHSLGMTLVLCVLTYLQAGPLRFMLP
jgi:lactate permease